MNLTPKPSAKQVKLPPCTGGGVLVVPPTSSALSPGNPSSPSIQSSQSWLALFSRRKAAVRLLNRKQLFFGLATLVLAQENRKQRLTTEVTAMIRACKAGVVSFASEQVRTLKRKRRLPRLFACSAIMSILMTACSDNHETPSISHVALKMPSALVSAVVADCLTGTLTAGTRSAPLAIVGDQASATISGIPPGSVDVSVDFFCGDINLASASQSVTVVAGQNLEVVFSDSDFTILLVWDVTSWDEGLWAE